MSASKFYKRRGYGTIVIIGQNIRPQYHRKRKEKIAEYIVDYVNSF